MGDGQVSGGGRRDHTMILEGCISSLYVNTDGDMILRCHGHPKFKAEFGPSTRVNDVDHAWVSHLMEVRYEQRTQNTGDGASH